MKPIWVGQEFSVQGFAWTRTNSADTILTLWEPRGTPSNDTGLTPRNVTVSGCRFTEPVWVNLLNGEVRAIPGGRFVDVPLSDWPVLMAERKLVPLAERER